MRARTGRHRHRPDPRRCGTRAQRGLWLATQRDTREHPQQARRGLDLDAGEILFAIFTLNVTVNGLNWPRSDWTCPR